MSDRDHVVKTYCTADEVADLDEFADRAGKSRSEVVRQAIREYIDQDRASRIEKLVRENNRLLRGEGVAGTDGGQPHGHAPATRPPQSPTPSRPSPQAATDEKVAYLADRLLDTEVPKSRQLKQVTYDRLRELVDEEYGFRDDTAERYVGLLVEHFDLRAHPTADNVLVTPDEEEQLVAEHRQQVREEADRQLEEVADAE
jgi:hypothetical protein